MDGTQPCAKVDPEIFFPIPTDRVAVAHAKSICNTCKFIEECLSSVVWDPEVEGIWGATTQRQRETMRTNLRKMGKGKTKV